MAGITNDDRWRANLIEYCETLLAYLHKSRFQYKLSGVYFWETFRTGTISILKNYIKSQVVPVFHYCSDCLHNEVCSHFCCKLWLQSACDRMGVVPLREKPSEQSCNLLMLATIASKERGNESSDHSADKQHKGYIERNIHLLR